MELRGASAVTDVGPLAALHDLRLLALEGYRKIEDAVPLANLHRLADLEIGGAWMTPRNVTSRPSDSFATCETWRRSSCTPLWLTTSTTARCWICRSSYRCG